MFKGRHSLEKQIISKNGINIAIFRSDELLITDVQSALDFIVSTSYNDDCDCVLLNKEAITKEFFVLSSGIAGEILQKFVNYSKKLAIVGDFSIYTSESLKDFICESNKGNCIFFVATEQEGIDKLA